MNRIGIVIAMDEEEKKYKNVWKMQQMKMF